MKVRIRNQIQFDEQVEQIDQRYDGKWMQKGSYCYLVFKNEENEQVVLKFHMFRGNAKNGCARLREKYSRKFLTV